ncbi:MAG: hypothetical protein J7500_16770 [Sphingomonas sp.]|uniref:hypothetical protein n=1 Tax=Sphingomonas sp. TaxID=28214 RepID=UPI001B0A93F4|nr:hypothetical protein [Sphingomonas sp.]MBO9624363.1 hypothetical protein [Sphingomonas sp.]
MEPQLALGLAASVAGVGVLRLAWGSRRPWLTAAGWTLLGGATVLLGASGGAWGMAIATVVAMLAAGVPLAHNALVLPGGRARTVAEAANAPGWRFRASDLGRRLAVFALVVPLGFAAAQLLAFGAQAAARRAGWGDADTLTLALLLQPIAWTVLAAVQITRAGPLRMILPALVVALAGLLLWWPL